jgi:outer membrane lipoprotein SlyB
VAEAALGRCIIGGKIGAAIGGVAGAIAGGLAGNKLAEFAVEVTEELNPTVGLKLGTNNEPVELPRHYSWEELQALSKPQISNVTIM